ncbi:MAG: DsrE/DsrF/DrsH-like family protein [Magnetococcales bacterium]|nr:DsrE/DsrF/DrsH-like family protein [Magnetococcales bacterium]
MSDGKKMVIVASKGTLDWAYPPLILAATAASMDYDVTLFYSFYGLEVLKKKRNLRISPLGNPAMPMLIPMPVIIQMLPGVERLASWAMKRKMAAKGVASVESLLEACQEMSVRIIACQMTVDLFEYQAKDFIDGVEFAGAAVFMQAAGEADLTLFI